MMVAVSARRLGWLAAAGVLSSCGGGTSPEPPGVHGLTPPAGCAGACADTPTALTAADVQTVVARAVAEAQQQGAAATVAVVDRTGNVLGVFRMFGAATSVTLTAADPGVPVSGGLEDVNIVPAPLAAIAKAITAAYLSTEGNAFSTRTAGQIVQEHFNPGERLQPGGPLFGVQFSQLPCSDLLRRFGGAPAPGPHRSPLGLAADPGGLPLYKAGTVVGAIGVQSDSIYGIDRDVTDSDRDRDELIALAGAYGLGAPGDRRADRITVDGKVLRFSDATEQGLAADPGNPPSYASLDGVAGTLIAVPGYFGGAATAAGTAFGHAASGIRPDRLDYSGLDAFVLVDAFDIERFRPQPGTDGLAALTAGEVRELLRAALALANRSRAQIRRPLGTPARVTISVVDTNGAILGIVRSRDAPVFGIDVSLQKARSAAFFSGAAAATALGNVPAATYLDGGLVVLRDEPLAQYVGALRAFVQRPTALADGAVAFSARALGNLSRPFFPDGLDGGPSGPLSKPPGEWSPFSTGLELDLVYNALVQHVGFVLGAAPDVGLNCTGVDGFDAGFGVVAPIAALANGAQIFPGSVPIYRGATLVGAIGVSGDGVDQDDLIAFLAVHEAGDALGTIGNAPTQLRADTLAPLGLNLKFVNCPVAPFLGSAEQSVCAGK
jgi:uncharacterized protein GlcG (DUF336 family)